MILKILGKVFNISRIRLSLVSIFCPKKFVLISSAYYKVFKV